jgi:hypothetical protein
MAEMAVVLEDHSPATLHDEEDLWPALGRTTVPESFHLLASGSKMRTSSKALNLTCFFFLAGAVGGAEEPVEEPVEGRRCRRQCGRRRCGRRDCRQVWIA